MDSKDKKDMLPEDEYLKQMSSLPKVKAPDDFLQKVRARIEKRPLSERIIGALFVPFRIKIPLEVAAVTATLLLVMSSFDVVKPSKQLASVPKSDVEEAVVGKAEEGKGAKRKSEKAYDQICSDKPLFEYSGGKDQAVISDEMVAPKEKKAVAAVEFEERPAAPAESGNLRVADADTHVERSKMKCFERSDFKADTVSLIKSLITSVHGTMTHMETDKSTGKVLYIDAEIPASNYESFKKSLEEPALSRGIKAQPILKDPPQGVDIIQVRISF